jgi:hypothetical protein
MKFNFNLKPKFIVIRISATSYHFDIQVLLAKNGLVTGYFVILVGECG